MDLISILKSKKIAIFLFITLILIKIAFITHSDITGDEYLHYFAAKYIHDNGELFYGKEIFPNFNWSTYTPFYHLVLASFMFFTQSAEISRYIFILWTIISTYFLYKLFYPYDKSGIIAVISNFNFINFFHDPTGLQNYAFFSMLMLITLYFFIKNKIVWTVSYIFLNLTKNYLGLLILPIFLYDSWQQKKYKKFIFAIVLTIPLFIFFLALQRNWYLNWYTTIFDYNIVEISQVFALTFLPFIIMSLFGLKKDQRIFWIAGTSFGLIYFTGLVIFKYFIPSALFTFFLIYLFLKNLNFKHITLFFIFFVVVNLSISFYYANYNCPFLLFGKPIFNLYFWDNLNCLNPYFKESLNFIKTLPKKSTIIFGPFPAETYFWTGINQTQNYDMLSNNATHVFIMKQWFVANQFFYSNVKPDIRNWNVTIYNWDNVYENDGVVILQRKDIHSV